MAEMRIVTVGDADGEILRKPAMRVRTFGPELHAILDDMVATMRNATVTFLTSARSGLPRTCRKARDPAVRL